MANKVELLSPAGDFNKGKFALNYGADAIYLGAKAYSLRARASNFDFDELAKIIDYAHSLNKKIYLVTNILCHNSHINSFDEFITKVIALKPDGFICADPFIINGIQKHTKDIEVHISTQQSICNSKAALFFKDNGASRVVLAREVAYQQIVDMIKNLNHAIDIEYFIHGALCIAYSGRCMISNNFSLRDSNVGGCSQSCR
ncbi:MAG: U32 family peptidase [Mycoplasmoidaceae bacterium]|nr:U32 family peptidase [Mycoplasmoidaceae bacterium]